MTRSTPVHKYKALLGSLLLAAVLILSNVFTYMTANHQNSLNPSITSSEYDVVYYSALHPTLNVNRFVPAVVRLEDGELQKKIQKNLREAFFEWLPEKYKYPEPTYMGTSLSTDKYLSVEIVYTYTSGRTDHARICNTLDMSTGEVLYLDDIMEVDDELVSMILTEGVIKLDFDIWSGEHDVSYQQDGLDRKRPEKVLEQLQLCSVPFSEAEHPTYKPTFYLEENRLYLLNIFDETSSFYIELDKISHKLKVEPW